MSKSFEKNFNRAYQAAAIEPQYKPRHVTQAQLTELTNLWHLAKTALVGKDDSRHQRMIWASKEFNKLHPSISSNAAYKDLSNSLD